MNFDPTDGDPIVRELVCFGLDAGLLWYVFRWIGVADTKTRDPFAKKYPEKSSYEFRSDLADRSFGWSYSGAVLKGDSRQVTFTPISRFEH